MKTTMNTTRSFARKIDVSASIFPQPEEPTSFGGVGGMPMPASRRAPLVARGSGSMGEAAMHPSCLWKSASTIEKVGVGGGATVALGAAAMAFLGPAKMMTMYLIGSAVGAGVAAISYFKLASDNADGECGAAETGGGSTTTPIDTTQPGACAETFAKLPVVYKKQVDGAIDLLNAAKSAPSTKSFADSQRTAVVNALRAAGFSDAAKCLAAATV